MVISRQYSCVHGTKFLVRGKLIFTWCRMLHRLTENLEFPLWKIFGSFILFFPYGKTLASHHRRRLGAEFGGRKEISRSKISQLLFKEKMSIRQKFLMTFFSHRLYF